MLKILKSGFSNTWTVNFLMFKLVLEKAEEPEIKLPTSTGSSKKQESSRKTSTSGLLTMPKPLTVWITINCGKFWRRWEYQTSWPASWETYMQISAGSRRETLHSWQRSWGRRLGLRKGGIEPQESPWKFSSIYPKTRVCLLSALCFHLHLWLYGGLSPTTSLWKKS